MKNTDDLSHINESFDLLVKKIEEAPDNLSQDEMDEIVDLFSEIYSDCEKLGVEPNNLSGEVKKKQRIHRLF